MKDWYQTYASPLTTLLICGSKMAAEVGMDLKEKERNPSNEANQSALADGLMQIFKPAVEELDDKVVSVRYSLYSANCGDQNIA